MNIIHKKLIIKALLNFRVHCNVIMAIYANEILIENKFLNSGQNLRFGLVL